MRIKDLPSTNSVSPADFIVVDQNPTNPVTRRATLASALGQNAQAEVLTSVSGVDTITATSAQAFTDYAAGQRFQFGTAGANTGAVTLAVNGLAAKAVVAADGTALTAGALPAGTWVTVEYNGTAFTVLGYHVLRSSWGAGAVGNTPAGGIAATTVQGALNELDTEKISFTRLDDSDGSSLVGFLQAGTGAVTRTAQSKMRDVVSVKDFGAVGDGVADDTAAINAAITYAKTLVAPRLIIDNGTYLTSGTLSFDLPNYSTMEFLGVIRTATGNPAVRIGSTSTNPVGYRVTGIKVERTTNDTSAGSVGVQIRNVVASYIDIRRVTGFQDGVLCYADQGNGGISYNEIHLGFLHDNRYNLHLQAVGAGGYVNENVFVGGTFNHSSGYPAVSTINIWIDYATYRNNNNRFICPSLEDNSTLGVAAVINGDNNLILHPRLERIASQSTYQIQFTANSSENQIIGAGFTMVPTNINDLGSGNCYETRQNVLIQKQTGAGEGLLRLRSNATSSARVWVAEDSGGTARAYARGDGKIVSTTNGYFEGGIRYSTGSGTLEDRGLFVGSGSPNGVVTADPGSLYMNTAGGANTTLWVKESGGGNTGWVAK